MSFPESAYPAITTADGPVRNPNPATGVSFDLRFPVPPGSATELDAKVVVTAWAQTATGDDYYPPVFPCVTDMADVPVLTVPLPAVGSSAALDLSAAANAPTCNGDIFDFGLGTQPGPAAVPVSGPWMLGAFALLLAALGLTFTWRRS